MGPGSSDRSGLWLGRRFRSASSAVTVTLLAGTAMAGPTMLGAAAETHPPISADKITVDNLPTAMHAAVVHALSRSQLSAWPATADSSSFGNGFGGAVAVSGNTAVIGAWKADKFRGLAYVFVKSGGKWHQQAKIRDPGATNWDGFGGGVAVQSSPSRTYAVISADPKKSPGVSYIFARSGSTWHRQATLRDPDPNIGTGLNYGFSIATSGATVVVGAYPAGSGRGAAYVYVRSGAKWHLQATFLAARSDSGRSGFGYSVALSGNTAVVGEGSGVVYVFGRSGKTWHRQAVLKCRCKSFGPDFGISVAISGSAVLVGASGAPDGSGRGLTYVFVRSGKKWLRKKTLTDPSRIDGDNFGAAVAISGRTALIGAPYEHLCGVAYIYKQSRRSWKQRAKLVQPGPSKCKALDIFGSSVDISGRNAVIGAQYENEAFLFTVP